MEIRADCYRGIDDVDAAAIRNFAKPHMLCSKSTYLVG